MYSHIEDKNYNHLVCVILGGSEKECKLHGLAHVGEHMCLLHYLCACTTSVNNDTCTSVMFHMNSQHNIHSTLHFQFLW